MHNDYWLQIYGRSIIGSALYYNNLPPLKLYAWGAGVNAAKHFSSTVYLEYLASRKNIVLAFKLISKH